MAKNNKPAKPDVMKVFASAAKSFHDSLITAKVRWGVVMVTPNKGEDGVPTAPAVRVHGVKAPFKVELVPEDHRCHASIDVRIKVDADWWEKLDESEALALADDALACIGVLTKEQDGEERPILCEDGRPKLQLVPADYVLAGREAVIRRHGEKSLAAQSFCRVMKTVFDENGQGLLAFTPDDMPTRGDDSGDADDTDLGINDADLAADGAKPGRPRPDGFDEPQPLQLTGPAAERAHVDRTRGKRPKRAAAKRPERKTPRRNGKH